ncbi:MAG: hypothetical protein WAZ21_02530 [Candidatus Saccharimonadales bacterium]
MQQEFYQIYEDRRPLKNHSYPSMRHANKALQNIFLLQKEFGFNFGFDVENRLSFMPIRHTLALRKKYADGSTANVSYTVKLIKPFNTNANNF